MKCTIELLGIPRQLAATNEVELELKLEANLKDLVAVLGQEQPRLLGKVIDSDRDALVSPYRFYQEGRGLLDDFGQKVEPGSRLVLMSAAVGG